MLTYNTLKDKAKEFLAVTGLKIEEFARLLPAFESGYRTLYPADKTAEGKTRRRQPGGGAKGVLQTFEDKLLLALLEVVWVILGVERVEYTHYCRLSCIPRGR
jgi:hypothetical protein